MTHAATDHEVGKVYADHNPRYVQYARVHGREPADMLEHDRTAWPGGIMAGFTLWIGDHWATWRKNHGHTWDSYLSQADHADYDAWLATLPVEGGE